MHQRLPVLIFAAIMVAIPFIPGIPPFWIVLLNNIGLAALVAMGLVLLTGVGGLTSFGQAAFCGFGAYTTAVLTTAYGFSPWLTLPLSLLVSGIAAVLLGIVTVRLSGHYLPLGTIAWGIGLFYLFSKLEFLGRNDGISGIPPLSIGTFKMLDPGTIYFAIWAGVLISALLTMNLLDSRTGRAHRRQQNLFERHLDGSSERVESSADLLAGFPVEPDRLGGHDNSFAPLPDIRLRAPCVDASGRCAGRS